MSTCQNQLEGLVDQCRYLLSKRITRENCVGLANLAELLQMDGLLEKCTHFILQEELKLEDLGGIAPSMLGKLYSLIQFSRSNPNSSSVSVGDRTCREVFLHQKVLECYTEGTVTSLSIFFKVYEVQTRLILPAPCDQNKIRVIQF